MLGAALGALPHLTSVDLSHNPIEDTPAANLCTALLTGGSDGGAKLPFADAAATDGAQASEDVAWERKRAWMQSSSSTFSTSIAKWGQDVECAHEFMQLVRQELLGTRVFVFTESGGSTRILNLARGATLGDAANLLGTSPSTHVPLISGSPADLSTQLSNGEIVSFIDRGTLELGMLATSNLYVTVKEAYMAFGVVFDRLATFLEETIDDALDDCGELADEIRSKAISAVVSREVFHAQGGTPGRDPSRA